MYHQALTGILTEQKLISDCRYRVSESSSLVPVLFREVFSHPYISLFHLLVNGFSVTCFRTFFQLTVTELSIRCTQVTIWNHDKGKLILMLQVRQVISLVTSHPYLPFCRHIIPILNFIRQKIFMRVISFVNKVIPMQQCCFK